MERCVRVVLAAFLAWPGAAFAADIRPIRKAFGSPGETSLSAADGAKDSLSGAARANVPLASSLLPSVMAATGLPSPVAGVASLLSADMAAPSAPIDANEGRTREEIDAAPWLDTNIVLHAEKGNKSALHLLKTLSMFKLSGQVVAEIFPPLDTFRSAVVIEQDLSSLSADRQDLLVHKLLKRQEELFKRWERQKKFVVPTVDRLPVDLIEHHLELRREVYDLLRPPGIKDDPDANVLAGIILHSPYREAVIYTGDRRFFKRVQDLRSSPRFGQSLDRVARHYRELFSAGGVAEGNRRSLYIPKPIFIDLHQETSSQNPRDLPAGQGWHALRVTDDPLANGGNFYTVIRETPQSSLPLEVQSLPDRYPELARKLGIEHATDHKRPVLRVPDAAGLEARILRISPKSRPAITRFKWVKKSQIIKRMRRWSKDRKLTIASEEDYAGDLAGYLLLPEEIVKFSQDLAYLWLEFHRIADRQDQRVLVKKAESSLRALKQRLDEATSRLAAVPEQVSPNDIAKILRFFIYQENDPLMNPDLGQDSLPGRKRDASYLRSLRKNCLDARNHLTGRLKEISEDVARNIRQWKGTRPRGARQRR